MWTVIVRIILRNRLANLIIIGLATIFMAYQAMDVELSYEMAKMLPASDSTSIEYQKFKNTFGEDGSVIFVGIKDGDIFKQDKFNDYYDLTFKIKEIDGVEEVISLAKIYHLVKNDSLKKFDFKPVIQSKPENQKELDSLKNIIYSLPFYDGFLINKETKATVMAITLDKAKLNTKKRIPLIKDIKGLIEEFGLKHNIEIHYSGLPYIRTITSKMVEDELKFFVILAIVVAALALFFFFRSFKAVIFSIFIVIISVVWVFGFVTIFGYKISILTGIIPPLMIIIGVENCIFLLNKYHQEYKNHGNKVKALSRVVGRVGAANFLTNATTAAGFAAFIVTGNKILVEFGIIASINIIVIYLLSLMLIPIFFSYLGPPKKRHTKHLDNKVTVKIVSKLIHIVQNYRNIIYVIVVTVFVIGIFGIARLSTTGNMVDDIPKNNKLYKDLMFFEENFNGILPFEISIDTKTKRGVMNLTTIRKIDELQKVIKEYPEFSKPISVAEVVKFARQAFYNGKEAMYVLPGNQEINFILPYVPKMESNKRTILNNFIDTNLQVTRISIQMKNIGTNDIKRIKDEIRPKIDSIFNPGKFLKNKLLNRIGEDDDIDRNKKIIIKKRIVEVFKLAKDNDVDIDAVIDSVSVFSDELKYELIDNSYDLDKTDDFIIKLTGTSVVFLKGTNYLIGNLVASLILAVLLIVILMALLFTSFRMILVSLLPNILPLLLTAALMGYLGISIKPSTILIFSIALGISVDNTIHFLSRYRLYLKLYNWNIKESVISALQETGHSMFYSSVVLFLGFSIFMLSSFGGTEAMGYLIAFTLLIAAMANLFVLPSVLLSLDKRITTKGFKEPLLEIFDEEEDIELDDLEIESYDTRGSA